jgi:hypothetical protein
MALTPVEEVRFLIGLGPTSPFYDLVSDAEIEWALERTNGNIIQAARLIAISLSFQLAGYNTRERVGDEEIWNSVSTSYLAALKNFITDPAVLIPNGLMPWSANKCPSKLMSIEICDGDNCKEACDCACESTSVCNCVAGPTF